MKNPLPKTLILNSFALTCVFLRPTAFRTTTWELQMVSSKLTKKNSRKIPGNFGEYSSRIAQCLELWANLPRALGRHCPLSTISGHPHPPYLQNPQKMPYICHTMGSVWHESPLKSRDFYRKYGIRRAIRTRLWHTNPLPPFMPYEPF